MTAEMLFNYRIFKWCKNHDAREGGADQRIKNLLSNYSIFPLSRKAMTYTGLLGIVVA